MAPTAVNATTTALPQQNLVDVPYSLHNLLNSTSSNVSIVAVGAGAPAASATSASVLLTTTATVLTSSASSYVKSTLNATEAQSLRAPQQHPLLLVVTTESGVTAASQEEVSGLSLGMLWLPYVVFTVVLLSLIALSFVRFHCQRGHQYRRRQAELGDKQAQLMANHNDSLRLLADGGSSVGSGGGGGMPNGGGPSSYVPEHLSLFVQYSQVVPDEYADDAELTRIERTTTGSRSPRTGAATGNCVQMNNKKATTQPNGKKTLPKQPSTPRKPLVFTFNSNGSMVDVRCEEKPWTNTFRLLPNATSSSSRRSRLRRRQQRSFEEDDDDFFDDDGGGVVEIDLGNGDPSQPLDDRITSSSARPTPARCRSNDVQRRPLNALPSGPPAAGSGLKSAGLTPPSVLPEPARTSVGSVHFRTTTSSATPHTPSNRLVPSSPTPIRHARRRGSPTPPRFRSPSTGNAGARSTALASASSTTAHRPAPHHKTSHHVPRRSAIYSPLDTTDRYRKDFSSDEEMNCAAEALLLWQKRV